MKLELTIWKKDYVNWILIVLTAGFWLFGICNRESLLQHCSSMLYGFLLLSVLVLVHNYGRDYEHGVFRQRKILCAPGILQMNKLTVLETVPPLYTLLVIATLSSLTDWKMNLYISVCMFSVFETVGNIALLLTGLTEKETIGYAFLLCEVFLEKWSGLDILPGVMANSEFTQIQYGGLQSGKTIGILLTEAVLVKLLMYGAWWIQYSKPLSCNRSRNEN